MRIKYYPDGDMLVIALAPGAPQAGGQDAGDPDIVAHYDAEDRLVELEISHASKRVRLDELRKSPAFEVVDYANERA